MSTMFNRPYTFELAHQVVTSLHTGEDNSERYANAARNGVARDQLDRAVAALLRIAPSDFDSWIRGEYIVDGLLHGYLDREAAGDDASWTTWRLGQLADQYYRAHA